MDEGQKILGEGHAGPSNPLRVGILMATTNVRDEVDKACKEVGRYRADIMVGAIGLAWVCCQDIYARTQEKLLE